MRWLRLGQNIYRTSCMSAPREVAGNTKRVRRAFSCSLGTDTPVQGATQGTDDKGPQSRRCWGARDCLVLNCLSKQRAKQGAGSLLPLLYPQHPEQCPLARNGLTEHAPRERMGRTGHSEHESPKMGKANEKERIWRVSRNGEGIWALCLLHGSDSEKVSDWQNFTSFVSL